ncbi:MAG TPA: outer membrane beta-barrel protein [Acidobacteriaceae bacterium]|nr:outer membrane beta-barrel protein [Acidobacteriaceae bacterium]
MSLIRLYGPRVRCAVLSLLVSGLALLLPAVASAQNPTTPQAVDSGADAGGTTVSPTDAAILKELEAMRARIAELEAQLQAEHTANANAAAAAALSNESRALVPASAQPAAAAPASGAEAPATIASSSLLPAASVSTATAQAPANTVPVDKVTPFADSWWGWLNGNARTIDCPLCTRYFTPEIRVDTNYNLDFNHPADDTIGGSSEVFRSQEVQLEQLGVGGDLLIDHVHARLMTQFGEYSVTTPRNDASVSRGQWNLDDAYRYLAEAYGGYHWDTMHGVNVDAGIFLSYIGLFSYYNFDNWAYQPSFVSSNTPWFFNGVRAQFYPTQHLKIEPWFINGWQSYARFGTKPGLGGQIKWTPTNRINIISNNYGYGEDDYGIHGRTRFHTDNSFELKYYDQPDNKLDRMAFSFTGDAGCESGTGVACTGSANHKIFTPATSTTPATYYQKQSFLGWMLYNRFWFDKDKYGLTLGGGQIDNPGRYLVLLPPINGATAVTGSAYFPEDPGQPFHGEDGTLTYDYMPSQYITFRTEYGYRHSDVPYWAGRGGSTPPGGTSLNPIGNPDDFTCTNGTTSADSGIGYTPMPWLRYTQEYAANIAAAKAVCAANSAYPNLWQPDMRHDEQKIIFAILVKF